MNDPTHDPTHLPLYTYGQVRDFMCEACALKVPDSMTDGVFMHHLNGTRIICLANKWRTSNNIKSACCEFVPESEK